jgi:hypothetical protein
MNKILFPLEPGMQSAKVGDLQAALQFLLDRGIIQRDDENARRELSVALAREHAEQTFGEATRKLVGIFQEDRRLEGGGKVDEPTADVLNRLLDELHESEEEQPPYVVKGTVRFFDGFPAARIMVSAFDRDLRREQTLGQTKTDMKGSYEIQYFERKFLRAEKGSADLVVKAFAADGTLLAASPVLFNAPLVATVDLDIPADVLLPPTLFEKIGRALVPLLENVKVVELEEDKVHQDLTFLSGETGFDKTTLARFVLAHRLALQAIQAEFWFVLLGGSFYQFMENQNLKEQLAAVLDTLPSLDVTAVRKSFVRGFNQKEISDAFRDNVAGWIEEFLKFIASRSVKGGDKPTFVKLALEDANITDAKKQETFARLFNEYRALTPELLDALEKDAEFKKEEIADLRTSFELSDLTRSDFSVVRMIKKEFGIRQPEQIRSLAKKNEDEWVKLVRARHAAGDITLPFEISSIDGKIKLPEADVYGKTLERHFREAFPTTAFSGGLERAMRNGGAKGLRQPEVLGRFLNLHEDFELLNTPVDDFLKNGIHPEFKSQAKDETFRLELKAVQRVFKLAPAFEAADALLADDLHSAQKIYRLGQSEFVRRFEKQPGFSTETARLAWNRAADTHAAVLTIIGDLAEFDSGILPGILKSSHPDLKKFPNWENLFQSGDICHCEQCRSVLSPAAYFADLLMFLRDRKSNKAKPGGGFFSVKDILFNRRPDLGYLELNCENALTTLPYIDVVCEVLERAVDTTGDNDLVLTGFTTVPVSVAARKGAVANAFAASLTDPVNADKEKIDLGADFSLSQVSPSDPDRWVVHGDDVTYLLKKKPPSTDFFAEILPNIKASAAELRAYPQYVNPIAYKTVRTVKYPLGLPFDLFAEEVRVAFQKTNLQRWDLMRTLRGAAAPNNPTDGEIAAEYFGISTDANAAFDEKRLILVADPTNDGQKEIWGEKGGSWLNDVGNVKNFLRKTSLEYNELLALLDLKFINPVGDIIVHHRNSSCDTDQKVIQVLDAPKLDRIHRFLRLWRKLKGWKMWELDLVIRQRGVGDKSPAGEWLLSETFLINLFYFSQLRNRLSAKTTIEQMCALFDDLNTETRFTKLHETREDALYQNLFLNRRLINPPDTAFQLDHGTGDLPAGEILTAHHPVILAALGIREADLVLLKELTKADGTRYITDDLTLSNLSFLWRHAWLSKLLKFKAEEWKTLLRLFQQNILQFADPKAAWEFVEKIDHLKTAGFTPDELNWLLAADRSTKAAVNEADAVRFLAALRKDLQAIQAEYDSSQYGFLNVALPTDVDGLTALLTSLLQKLNRNEAAVNVFLKTLRGSVLLEASVQGLPVGFAFPAAITAAPNHIPIEYDEPDRVLRFNGVMTDAQRVVLLSNALPAAVTDNIAYVNAIEDLFQQSLMAGDNFVSIEVKTVLPGGVALPGSLPSLPIRYNAPAQKLSFTGVMTDAERVALHAAGNPASAIDELFRLPRLAVKFFEPVFTASLEALPSAIDFKTQLSAELAVSISYDVEQKLLRFAGIMNEAEQSALNGIVPPAETAYHSAVNSLAAQPQAIMPPDDRIWLMDTDLDPTLLANNTLAKRLANAAKKALNYLSKTLAANTVVQQTSAQQGLTEALTRSLLEDFAVMPPILPAPQNAALLDHITRVFATTSGSVDYTSPTMKLTFDGWFWVNRVAAILKKWKITLTELKKIIAVTAGAQLLDLSTLPLDDSDAIAPIARLIRTSRLLRLRNSLPETQITLLEVLEKLNNGRYAAAAVEGLPVAFVFPAAITAAPHNIPINYDEPNKRLRFNGPMSDAQKNTLLTDASLAAVTGIVSYQDAINELWSGFAADVQRLNDVWIAAEVQALTSSLDLTYPADYLLTETWERLRRAFYFLDNLNASTDLTKTFAATAMTDKQTKAVKELLRSKFGTETWLTLSAEIQDVLRERKRDALAAYLLTQPKPTDAPSGKWENTNDLYAYYLLDVEMSSCQLTSRLVQGSGSVQLFVQRCFMGLEPNVVVNADGTTGDSAWRWWKWMRKYRVWEANRKVFLWPENWIEPELKKDRSPFFKDLENELLQNEVNQYTAETAFTNYLEKLDGVAQLEIAGFYQEDDGDNAIIHVFGRTKGAEPHLYYYRRYDYRQWTPWEKVELDIQGDYLIPTVINKRMFLFWPTFTELPDEEGNRKADVPSAGNQATVPRTKKRLQMQMAVSDYRQGKWTPKRVSTDFDYSRVNYDIEIKKDHYQFFAIDKSPIDGSFGLHHRGHSIDNIGSITSNANFLLGAMFDGFNIVGCKGLPELLHSYNEDFVPAIRPERTATGGDRVLPGGGTMFYDAISSKWQEQISRSDAPQNDFTLLNQFPVKEALRFAPILLQTPDLFTMTPPWQTSYFDRCLMDGNIMMANPRYRTSNIIGSWLPFFYNDKKRSFFVLPTLAIAEERTAHSFVSQANTIRIYYPEIKKVFRQWEITFEGQTQTWLDTINLSTLNAAQRQLLENALSKQFPEMEVPPYTDAQIKSLMLRFNMRFFHFFLGVWALGFFQFRQFHFKNFYHPFVCDFAKLVYNPLKGIPALMSRETQLKNTGFIFKQSYVPTPWVVELPPQYPSLPDCFPREVVDFTPDGAYSSYNWELFFHAPLLIANSLSRNQRFEEARDWYHFIFNPIGVESAIPGGAPMSKYWITKPFFETTGTQYVQHRIDNILHMLAGDTSVPGYSAQAKKDLEDQVLDWRTNPFEPHRIANYRTVAYQKTVVMKYLDNLIAWGDYLFQQDSMESINEATQLYILASEILGQRPKKNPPQAKPPLESFNELEKRFDKFSNALVEVENLVPPLPGSGLDGADPAPLPMLYFCIPHNDKMLGYWDTVADRLYKIRHCMNIEGVVRQLALFEPPIDPGALVKAVAAGMDISSALADLNAPLPLYRFNALLQKANEVCNDMKALGSALLAALEKNDAEALSLLRQGLEINLLEKVKTVREKQIEEANENLEGVKKNKELVTIRRDFYQNIEKIIRSEQLHQDKLHEALLAQQIAQAINIAASVAHIVPSFDIGAAGLGGSPRAGVSFGGPNVGSGLQAAAGGFTVWANVENYNANKASINAGHDRRWEDWKLQEKLANKELEQLEKSIAAAELRIAIAEKELENHVLQIENAKATDAVMRSKYTNQELYQWQVGQISGVYFQNYKLAYDLAKRAERCFRFELGLQDSDYIQFGYWDSLKKGLLSGEKLQYDLRRLESAYLEQNRREFELTKHISLLMLDPLALVKLKETGRCFINLPEEIFDLDFPGHYFRRIKSVSITLPCVAGPYTTTSCTLRLLKNRIRINTANGDNGYPRNIDDQGLPADDSRFIENNIPVKAIAASSAQNDSGVFELSFRDERYLPFEGAGAISEWSLELFSDLPSNNPDPENPDFGKPLRQFDYGTISDAILHIKYTAREDAGAFKNGAIVHLRKYFEGEDGATHSVRLFNLRQEFPTQWHRFLNPTNPANGNVFELEMSPNLFRILDQEKTLKVNMIWLLARCTDAGNYSVVLKLIPPPPALPPANSDKFKLVQISQYGGLHFANKTKQDIPPLSDIVIDPTNPSIKWQLKMTGPAPGGALGKNEIEDVFLVVEYKWETP